MTAVRYVASIYVASLVALVGCAVQAAETEIGASEQALSRASELSFTELPAPAGEPETRALISDAAAYRALFGKEPPKSVDFHNREALIFYSAGTKRTDGFEASIQRIEGDGNRVLVTTRLEFPSAECPVNKTRTNPRVMVKFRRPSGVSKARFRTDDTILDCGPRTCDDLSCPAGQRCELQEVVCVRAPCDPIPVCVDDPRGPACGGFLGTPCPGAGTCVDDRADDCDPENGGADCSGVCTCEEPAICDSGSFFDDSPEACACKSSPVASACATVLCAQGTTCQVQGGAPVCVPVGSMVCGSAICGPGTVCCNASCGICTPPDRVCIQIACP